MGSGETLKRHSLNGNSVASENGGSATAGNEDAQAKANKRMRKLYRVYHDQESMLTVLRYSNPHFGTLVNTGVHLMISLCLYDVIKNSVDKGRFHVDFSPYFMVCGSFVNYFKMASVWLVMMAGVIGVYPMFLIWARLRKFAAKPVDAFFVLLYLVANVWAHYFTITYIAHEDLAPGPSLFLSVEQIRFSMKTYSFLRENAYKVLWPWKKDDRDGPPVWYQGQMSPRLASLKQYLYFLFAPTFIYRDSYPQTKGIRWTYVFQYLFQFAALIVVLAMILKNFVWPSLEQLPQDPTRHLITSLLVSGLVGSMYCFTVGSIVLHAWSNLNAELTCFADRRFYEDWWTCTDYQTFYRKWNYLVYDWIHAYMLRDVRLAFKNPKYRFLTVIPALFVSSIFHEYIIAVGIKFFLPVLTIMFVFFGGIVYFLRPSYGGQPVWNTLFLWGVSTGFGWMVWGYAVEYVARIYCPPPEDDPWSAFKPQVFKCFF